MTDVANPGTIDALDLFADLVKEAEALDYDKLVVGKVKLFPDEEPFRVISTDNAHLQIKTAGGDVTAYDRLMQAYVHPDDRQRLDEKLSSFNELPGDLYAKLLQKFMEVAAARPTEPQSPSARSRTTRSTPQS